ncbi:hypothetical protein OROGR_010537 [Orobanche gracilis]
MAAAAGVGRAATTLIRRCFLQVWAEGLNRLLVLDSSGRVAARSRCGDSSRPGPGFPDGKKIVGLKFLPSLEKDLSVVIGAKIGRRSRNLLSSPDGLQCLISRTICRR